MHQTLYVFQCHFYLLLIRSEVESVVCRKLWNVISVVVKFIIVSNYFLHFPGGDDTEDIDLDFSKGMKKKKKKKVTGIVVEEEKEEKEGTLAGIVMPRTVWIHLINYSRCRGARRHWPRLF